MRHKFMMILLSAAMCVTLFSGCGQKKQTVQKELTPDDMHPTEYTDESEIPSGTFCIAHKLKSKKKGVGVAYYPLYKAESFGEPADGASGSNGGRYFWLNYNKDEGMLPTMYPGDKLVYKSDNNLPKNYTIEKFFDEGYTIGVAGLYANSSDKPALDLAEDGCNVCKSSDARVLRKIVSGKKGSEDGNDTAEIVFNAVNDKSITMDDVDNAGMIMGLKEGKTYNFDVRIGTRSYPTKLRANLHEFMLAETYKYNSFDYVTDTMIRVNLPDYLTTGYYEINGAGAFRFLKTEKSYKNLTYEDYNDFVYVYSGNIPTGTQDGLVLNEDGYLVPYDEYIDQQVEEDAKDYEDDSDEDIPDSSYEDDESDEYVEKETTPDQIKGNSKTSDEGKTETGTDSTSNSSNDPADKNSGKTETDTGSKTDTGK